jgi:two-component system phosphate regulon sensor histidine kinase PhoR
MWIAISILLLVAGLALHLGWRARARELESSARRLQKEITLLRESHEEAAAQTQSRQLAIFNSMVEGILIVDGNARVQTINKSLEGLFDINREIRGLTLMEAFRAHELPELYERVQKEGLVRAFELTLPAIHHTRYIEVNAAAIRNARDESDGTILIFHDYTRIKELESVRREFVANVSHELRTPLTLIKGYVETLLDGAKDDPAVATTFLRTIEKHTNRLTFLIEDLLNLSQLESGEPAMHRQSTNLHSVAERALDELRPAAARKNQTLQNVIDPQLEVNADADRLPQVFYNLIDNAIKYGRANGVVRVGADHLSEGVQAYVADDGPGIPPEARDRIFERFFRLDKARSREAGGTGLGLSIVKHIVRWHGGRVWVESGPEGGSTFYFTLPYASEPESGEETRIHETLFPSEN